MNGFERRRDKKKDAVLNAALALFNQYGYDSVSVEKIAKAASVSPVSIYNFYNTKENLKNELIRKVLNDNLDRIREVCRSEKSIQEKIEGILAAKSDLYRTIHINLLNVSADSNDIIKSYMDQCKLEVYDLIEKGKKELIFNPNISSDSILLYIDVFHDYFINNTEARNELIERPVLNKEMSYLFWNGLIYNMPA